MSEMPAWVHPVAMALGPDDPIVVWTDRKINTEQAEAIQEAVRTQIPGHEVLVLGAGVGMATTPQAGERCQLCNRRVNKKRTDESPKTVRVVFTLPADRAEPVEEGLDALQEIVGADPHSYPKGHLLEALVVLGAQQREELKRYFNGE